MCINPNRRPASKAKDSMTASQNQENKPVEQKNDKEYNFRQVEAKLQQERIARLEAEKRADESTRMLEEARKENGQNIRDDDEEDDKPYVDHKKLQRKLNNFEKNLDQKIEKKAEEKARIMLDKERQDSWLKQNPDFYEVMQHADKFYERDPELAETILKMPEGPDRHKLVYKTIKNMGLHKPSLKEPSIQEKVDANRRSPYYQPSGVGSAPYNSGTGDYSPSGQKNAYQKMQELKSKLRI